MEGRTAAVRSKGDNLTPVMMPSRRGQPEARVLYIASASICDPLIISQVVRYLRVLARGLESCHLLTFERTPLTPPQSVQIEEELHADGIAWTPLVARNKSRMLNGWREINNGYKTALRLIRTHRLNIVHGRSFVPGNIGLRACRKTRVRFLYDMRGFWAEEKWAKGTIRWKVLKNAIQRAEDRLFRKADMLISLTDNGKRLLQDRDVATPIDVIPCCVDTALFQWNGQRRHNVRRIISVGSLGPGYQPNAVFGVFAAAQQKWPNARLQLLTRTKQEVIDRAAKAAGCDLSRIDVAAVEPSEVPRYLSTADLGLCMIQPSVAKVASSPTRLAEYLASGVPVIANCDGIGDLLEIVPGNRVGVNLRSFDSIGYQQCINEVGELLEDPDVSARCRRLCEQRFSLEVGVRAYQSIYQRLITV